MPTYSGPCFLAEPRLSRITASIHRRLYHVFVPHLILSTMARVCKLDQRLGLLPFSLNMAYTIIFSPLTWLPALAYTTTFGYELAIDANLATVLYTLLKSPTFGQTKAGYVNFLE
jgi:hypothetical protein